MRARAASAIAFVLGCLLFLPGTSRAHRVLVVQSYDPEYVWCQQINKGIEEALKGADTRIEYFYMDAKRHPDKVWLTQKAHEALEAISRFDPDVVVTADDAVQEYLVVPYLKDKPRPQVIFCGVNAPLAKYGFPASNVSGVRERWHYRESFVLLKKLVPSVQSVAFLVDGSESGSYVLNDLKEDMESRGPYCLTLATVEAVRTFQEWQKKVLQYQSQADALALGLFQTLIDERTGKVVPVAETRAWLKTVVTKPTIGFADVAVQDGLLCGVLESAHEQGFLAGEMVGKLLTGCWRAGELPVTMNNNGIVLVNLKTAERLHVEMPYEIIEAAGIVVK